MKEARLLRAMTGIDDRLIQAHDPAPAGRSAAARKRRPLRAVLIAAAVAVLMVTAALAISPTLRDALQNALGGFIHYAQPLEGVVEDKGFRLEVLAALTDANNAVVYAELTDLEGDRLENAEVHGLPDIPLEDETAYSHSCTVERYDPEKRAVLLRFSKNAGVIIPDGAEGEIVLYSIQPGYHTFSTEPIPAEHIPDAYLDTMTAPSGETVLVPEQNPLDLVGKPGREGARLSSAGFAADGRLHYLVRFPEGTRPEDCSALVTTYSKSWTSPEDGADTFFNHDYQSVVFSYEGAVYYDHSTVAALSDRDDLKEISGTYGTYVTGEKIGFDEPLRLPVKLSVVDAVVSPLSGLIDHNTLQELRLSSVGVTILSASPDYPQIGGYPLTVFLSDGTSFHPKAGLEGYGADDRPNTSMARWDFDRPVEVEQITGVAIGAWMIPVENGTAGEGYWLSELPE